MLQFLLQLYNPRHQENNPNWLATKLIVDNIPRLGGTKEEKTSTELRKLSVRSIEHIAKSLLNNYSAPTLELWYIHYKTYLKQSLNSSDSEMSLKF